MAKPIQSTPVLKGKDAVNFLRQIEENKNKKADKSLLEDIRNSAKKLQDIYRPSTRK